MADLSVVYRISADITALQSGVNRAAAATEKLESNVTSVGKALLGAFGTTAVVAGIQQAVRAAVDYADALSNLNARTGVSVQGLQKLEAIGATSGVTMDTLARAVTRLQMNLDSPAAQTALRNLGLGFEQIRQLSPEEQFLTIARNLAQIDDPIARANAGAALFGKTWDQVAGAFEGNVDDIIANTHRMSDAQIAALEKAGDRWDLFMLDSGRRVKGFLGDLILMRDESQGVAESFGVLGHAWGLLQRQTNVGDLPKVGSKGLPVGAGPTEPDTAGVIQKSNDEITASVKTRQKAEDEAARAREASHAKLLAMSKEALGAEFAWQNQILLTKFKTEQLTVAESQLFDEVDTLANFVAAHKGEMFPEPPPGSLEKWKEGQQTIKEFPPHVSTLQTDLQSLSRTFGDLGAIGGKSLDALTRGIGSMISSMSVAISAVGTLKSGFGSLGSGSTLSGIASIASGIGGIVSIAATAISAVKSLWSWATGGEEAHAVNPARDAWFGGRSVQDIGNQLAPFMDGESARKLISNVFNAKNKQDFGAATGAIDTILNAPRMAGGGIVTQPTLAMIGEAGPELVTPLSRLGPGALTATGGQPPVIVNLSIAIDGVFSEGDLVQTVQRRVAPILAQTIEDNVAGSRTRFQDVLGVPG